MGRPPLSYIDDTVPVTVRMTTAQKDMFFDAGSGKWLRNVLDKMITDRGRG